MAFQASLSIYRRVPQVTDKLSVLMTATSSPTGARRAPAPCASNKQGGRIRVLAEATPWRSISGVKGEVTLRRQPSIGFIIDSDAFQFHIRGNTFDSPVAWFSSYPTQYSEISSAFIR